MAVWLAKKMARLGPTNQNKLSHWDDLGSQHT